MLITGAGPGAGFLLLSNFWAFRPVINISANRNVSYL